MEDIVRRLSKIQAATFAALAVVSVLPYFVSLNIGRKVFWIPWTGLALSWVVMSIVAVVYERSWRTIGPVHVSHAAAFALMLLVALGAIKGLWSTLLAPAGFAVCLGAVALYNLRAGCRTNQPA